MKRTVLALLAASGLAGIATQGICAESGPAPTPGQNLGFDLEILLSKQAAYELGRRKEGVVVSASYFGDPTPAAMRHANEIGRIDLGQEIIALRGISGPVRVTGDTVDRKRIGWLKGPPMVNVNVFTARRSSPNNLISCDIVDGPVARVAAGKTKLFCGLISEKRDVAVHPR